MFNFFNRIQFSPVIISYHLAGHNVNKLQLILQQCISLIT